MKILIVGLGAIGQRHVRNLRSLSGSNIDLLAYRARGDKRVLTDRLQVQAEQGLEELYSIKTFPTLESALAEQPTAVFICNPSAMHVPTALKAAQAGCHLFIEKPLGDSLERVDELERLVEAQGLVAVVGQQMRFHPLLKEAYQLVRSGILGRVLAVRVMVGEYLPNWHKYEDYRGTYGASRALGGGALLSQIHEFDYLYWFFGVPRRLWTVGGNSGALQIDVEDVASTLMEFPREGYTLPIHVQQDYLQRPPARTFEIVGEHGKLFIDLAQLCLRQYGDSGQVVHERLLPDFERNSLFVAELEHIMACVRGEEAPRVTIRDAKASLQMALAAHTSLQTGQIVSL